MKALKRSHIGLCNFLFLFCIIIFAGSATTFARSLGDIRTVGNAFAMAITALFVWMNRIKFNKRFWTSLFIFSAYAALTFVNNRRISPIWWSQWIICLTVAYCICQVFGRKFFALYERIIVILCILSIPFWMLLVLFPEATTSAIRSISFFSPYSEDGNVAGNILIFTVPPAERGTSDFDLIQRNAGFAWEPGAFASFICLAIFCNILRTDLRIRRNPFLWTLSFTLLTTQSTTGLIVLVCMILLWMMLKRKIWSIVVIIPVILLAVNLLPFMKNKLMDELQSMQYIDVEFMSGAEHSLGRFISLKLDFEEFLRHPVIGLGGYADGTWLVRQGLDNIATISGIGKLLSMYGAVMTLLFLSTLTLSSKSISESFGNNNGYILIVTILVILISYGFWTHPILISFWMYCIYGTTSQRKHESDNSNGRAVPERDVCYQKD